MPIFMTGVPRVPRSSSVPRSLSAASPEELRGTPRNPRNSSSHFSPRIRPDQIIHPRWLLAHERFAVLRANERAEVLAAGVDHLQELRVGDERLRLLRFRVVELR